MNSNMFKLGAIPSPQDERDYRISKLIPVGQEFPGRFSLREYFQGIMNQGQVSACMGESGAYTRNIMETKQDKTPKVFSPGFLYSYVESGQWPGPGRVPREVNENMRNIGAVLLRDFPDLVEFPQGTYLVDDQKEHLKELAAPYKITAYAQVQTLDEIKSAIVHPDMGAVSLTCPIYESFWTVSRDNPIVPIPDLSREKFYGYHQMTTIGWYENDDLEVPNSWGEDWGDGGFCRIPANFPFREIWAYTDTILPEKPKYWRVQVGAFKVKENAERYKTVLDSLGFPTYIVLIGEFYKVQTGAFTIEENAYKRKESLENMGINPFITYY